MPWSKSRKSRKQQAAAAQLELGEWTQGLIRCGKGHCDDLYWLHLTDTTRIVIEANGPTETGLPDFGLSLLDGTLEVLNLNRAARRRPRTIDETLPEGIYYVKLFALEKSDVQLSYQLRARGHEEKDDDRLPSTPTTSTKTKTPSSRESSGDRATPAPKPAPKELASITTDILEIERSGGAAVAVLVDAGILEGVRTGMRGELIDRGRVVGRIEVREVYSAGSRARIVGALTGKLTQDARARIYVPAP